MNQVVWATVLCTPLNVRQSATSQNFAELARAGVLSVEHRGTQRIYKVRGLRISAILNLIDEFCEVHSLYAIPDPSTPQADPDGISKS